MASLKQQLTEDIKKAMKDQAKDRLGTLRLISAAIKQKEVDERVELDDTQVLAVIDKLARQHRDSIEQYMKAGRDDLVSKEQSELAVVESYLPEQLSEEEVNKIIQAAIDKSGASSMKDMGKVIAIIKPELQGRADMSSVSNIIKSLLS
jgi:uncharacterized protein YqeY